MRQEDSQLAEEAAPTIIDSPRFEDWEDAQTTIQTPDQIAVLLHRDVDKVPESGCAPERETPQGAGATDPESQPDRETKALWNLAAVAALVLGTVVGATVVLVRWHHQAPKHITLPPQLRSPIRALPVQQPTVEPLPPPTAAGPTVIVAVPVDQGPNIAQGDTEMPPTTTATLVPRAHRSGKHHRRPQRPLFDENGIWIPVE